MPRFFAESVNTDNLVITGDDARHIGFSLRMKPGETLTLCCDGIDYFCSVASISESEVRLNLISSQKCAAEPNINVTLFQAIPKLDKLEFIIQKTVELGVTRIVPVLTRRCISRPTQKDFDKKLSRLNKISAEAAKQSGRGIIPQIAPMTPFKSAVDMLSQLDCSLILYEEGGISFADANIQNKKNIGIIIGSEGGFDPEEVALAQNAGAQSIWLGKRILRCETAPITAMSILMFLTKNM
ncbi:MAG: 16S rRNA (uracil(1498)-N(3))-methyltransferase [Ruminococcus sp.]|jgi:16S rRNA (uracil1498-N3)-methyltransferase|nr:16S rRNA (uracil(1498)-N(3))-methyltransferase [Ruminococcus sp.]